MRLVVLMLILVALAGCSGSESPDDGEREGHAAHGGGEMAQKPEWQVGQYWSYTDQDGTEFSIVVTDDLGSEWLLLNSELSNAWFDWMFDVSFLGPIQKSDLSGKQGNDKVRFFDFPLEHDKQWNTDWDGATRTVIAHAMDDGKWHLAVRAEPSSQDAFAEMLYDPSIGWFESMIFYDENGTEQYVLTLTGSGDNYVGNVHRYVSVDNVGSYTLSGPGTSQATFNAGEQQEMAVDYVTDCGTSPGQILGGLMPPNEDGSAQPTPPIPEANEPEWGFNQACPGGGLDEGQVVFPSTPGMWRWDGAVVNADGSFDIQVSLRAYETFTF